MSLQNRKRAIDQLIDSSPRPVTWMANKATRRTHFWRNERVSSWQVAIVSVRWTVHEYHRATIVSRLLYFRPWTNTGNNRNSWKWGFPRLVVIVDAETGRGDEKWWRLENKLIALLCVIYLRKITDFFFLFFFFFISFRYFIDAFLFQASSFLRFVSLETI